MEPGIGQKGQLGFGHKGNRRIGTSAQLVGILNLINRLGDRHNRVERMNLIKAIPIAFLFASSAALSAEYEEPPVLSALESVPGRAAFDRDLSHRRTGAD